MIRKEGLLGVHNIRSMLDGKDICALYEIKPGKSIKFLIEEQISF